jgi:two-component system chemotaxis response regulator CheB
MTSTSQLNILVIEDSAFYRKVICKQLEASGLFARIDTAVDGHEGQTYLARFSYHVISLDIEMPKMDGLALLKWIMNTCPTPVVMVSALTEKEAPETLAALSLGAVACYPKTQLRTDFFNTESSLVDLLCQASHANIRASQLLKSFKREVIQPELPDFDQNNQQDTSRVIVMGASTGGVEALRYLIPELSRYSMPPIVLVQHMPSTFISTFVDSLNRLSSLKVVEATQGLLLEKNQVIVACNQHVLIARASGQAFCQLSDAPKRSGFKPSVDELFDSLALSYGQNALGVLLTGMGDDGARGLCNMRANGSETLVQDQTTSVVWGMPKAALALDPHHTCLPLNKIVQACVRWVNSRRVGVSKQATTIDSNQFYSHLNSSKI